MEGLRAFIGGTEAVYLGGEGVGMTGETQDLLLLELRKRFHSIAAVGRKDLVKLSARVLAKALETEEQKELGRMLVHQTWPFFEPLVRSYLALFVEVSECMRFLFVFVLSLASIILYRRHREGLEWVLFLFLFVSA